MKYYVLGYDEGNLVLMTRREFSTLYDADLYVKSCSPLWRAFVVGEVL